MSTPSEMAANVTAGTSIPGTTSATTTLSSNGSTGISIPTSTSTQTSLPTTASTGTFILGIASTATTSPCNAMSGIPMPSFSSTPSVMPTNVITETSSMPIADPVGLTTAPSSASRSLANNELPSEEIYRHLNIYAVQELIPKPFCKILEWGCLKNPTDTFYDYIRDTKKLSHKQLKKIYNIPGDDLNNLMHVDPAHMDGPLLRKVIQATCEKLKDVSDDVWKENDETQIECLIGMLTNCRNMVCHEVKNSAISSTMFNEINRLLKELIQVGGKLYQQPQTEIDKELEELQRKIDNVTTTEYEREFIALQHLLRTTGYSETESYWKSYCTQDIHPFSNVLTAQVDVLYPLDIVLTSSSSHNRPMSYEKMFDGTGVDDIRPVLILQGEAGSGKSTILKQIAMQFFKLIKNTMPSLEQFDLLHFFQCNNRKFENLADLIESSFHETCKIVSPKKARKCYNHLAILILIDGYDEVNLNSVRVTEQLIEVCKKNPACQIVFTARPWAVKDLTDLLKREGVQFNIYQLLEISQEDKQLDFLRPLDRDSGLCRAFSALPSDVKCLFVRPISLVQFYNLFLNSPDKVHNWESIECVTRDILSQYENLITSKLKKHCIPNLKRFIKEVLQSLFDFAFEGLIQRKFTLDERACATLSDYCFEKIEEWGLKDRVDTNQILSVVYVTKVNPTKNAPPAYQYSHTSMQELMSARSLLSDLTLDTNLTLEEIIRTRIQNVKEMDVAILRTNYVNNTLHYVYQFVLMIFSAPDKRPYLLRWLPELETALSTLAYWPDVMMSCDRPTKTEQDEVAKIAAKEKLKYFKHWDIRTARDVTGIARMLPHAQPDILEIKLPESEGTPSDLAKVLKMFRGHLNLNVHHPYETYTNCENILYELNSSCTVTSLTGCLASSSASTRSLSATLQQPGARLDLSLENPSLHALQEIRGTKHILKVRMKHNNPPMARPLPRGLLPPLLIVEGTPESGAEELRAAILHYAPEDGVYFSLWLEDTLLDDAAIQQLLTVLEEAGIRTCYNRGETSFTVGRETSNGLCLHCRKAHTDASQRCVWLQLADGGKGDGEKARQWQRDLKPIKAWSCGFTFHSFLHVISSIVPDVMRRVIDWGCRKPESMTFLDYLNEKGASGCLHIFNVMERRMLEKNVLDLDSDVNMLCKLIPLVCERAWYNHMGLSSGNGANCCSVDGLVRGINDARKGIPQLFMGFQEYLIHLIDFEQLCVKLIIAAGGLYKIDKDLVKAEVTTTRTKFFKAWPSQRDSKDAETFKKDEDHENGNPIPSDDMTRFSCLQVISTMVRDIMRRVIDWGCRKPESVKFWDYIEERRWLDVDNFDIIEREMLRQNRLDMPFDENTLFKLIPLVCDNINLKKIYSAEKADDRSLEGLLRGINDAWKDIVRLNLEVDEYLAHLRNLEDLCTKLIAEAGRKYIIDWDSVEKEVTTTRCKFMKARARGNDIKAAKELKKDGDQQNLDIICSVDLTRLSCLQVISSIVPNIVRRVIDWGCRKPESMTFMDYVKERHGSCVEGFTKTTERKMFGIKMLDIDCGVNMVMQLIPKVCDNIELTGIPWYEKGHFSSVRGFLNWIDRVKYDIVFLPLEVDEYLTHLRDLEVLCTQLLIATGKLYAIDMDSVEKEVTTTRCKFFKVMDECFMRQPATPDQYRSTEALQFRIMKDHPNLSISTEDLSS